MISLTQNSTFIIGPVAKVLGMIMNALFVSLSSIGIANIGIAIILFTVVIKLLMMPLTIKQQKFTKLTNVMNPELQAIQKKYKNKKDQDTMMKANEEQKAVYAKYGTSPTGGCIQMVIQMPILFALWRVIQNIPAYVPSLKALFTNILSGTDGATGIMSNANFAETMTENFGDKVDYTNVNSVIDFMNTFTTDSWNKLMELFPNSQGLIQNNMDQINHMNNFLGINMSQNPGLVLGLPILIPILAALTQWLSVKMMQNPQSSNDDNPAAASMKMMTMVMPVMSGIMAISLPSGLGIYWICTAVVQIVMQLAVNRYFDKIGVEQIVKANVEKQNKKRAKKGLPPQKITNNAKTYAKTIENKDKVQKLQEKKETNDKKVKEILDSTSYYKSPKAGSLAEKAGMVKKYETKSEKKSKK